MDDVVATNASETQSLRILIAEDSEDNKFLLREYLKTGPYVLTFAENGKVAVERASNETFDLILMDVQMPVMDGVAAAKLIREQERASGKPSVLMLALTADTSREAIQLSYEAGLDGHVSKPVTRKELLEAIKNVTPQVQTDARSVSSVVDVPPGFEDAARKYIRSRNLEIPKLKELAESKQFEQLRDLAHNIKGTGAAYGFPDLTRVAEMVEFSAKGHDMGELSKHLTELALYTQDAEKTLLAAQPASVSR